MKRILNCLKGMPLFIVLMILGIDLLISALWYTEIFTWLQHAFYLKKDGSGMWTLWALLAVTEILIAGIVVIIISTKREEDGWWSVFVEIYDDAKAQLQKETRLFGRLITGKTCDNG
jgi:hypothetical protein